MAVKLVHCALPLGREPSWNPSHISRSQYIGYLLVVSSDQIATSRSLHFRTLDALCQDRGPAASPVDVGQAVARLQNCCCCRHHQRLQRLDNLRQCWCRLGYFWAFFRVSCSSVFAYIAARIRGKSNKSRSHVRSACTLSLANCKSRKPSRHVVAWVAPQT